VVTIQFNAINAGIIGDQVIHTDTSMGVQPAHVKAKPQARSLSSDFQLSTAASAFRLDCPTGTVVDVALTFKGVFVTATAAQNALVAANPGGIYLRGLDGLATAATILPPAAPSTDVI
jgi:hypothetical protein